MYAGLKAIEYCKISISWKRENLYDLLCEVSIENMNMLVFVKAFCHLLSSLILDYLLGIMIYFVNKSSLNG